jgi:U4/U6.U5 tri-snRNP-associated protein 3
VEKVEKDKEKDKGKGNGGKDKMDGVKITGLKTVTNDGDDDTAALMRQMMGFHGFRSTKQTKVPGNDWYAVRKEKKTEYRQYMNRQGGFNRPLSPSR